MKILTKIGLCLLMSINIAFAQSKITGNIKTDTQEVLPFANVVLYLSNDNDDFVKGSVSDANGNYNIEDVSTGTYWIEISVLGFETLKSEPFEIDESTEIKELNFTLKEEAQALNEVVVKSNRPVIRQTSEKLIVDLENSESINSNLQDVMKKVPGVLVINGRISYAGQQNIRILINGKRTDYIDTASLLRDFPADNIARIELVQQPGAEFDAEGSGPIIDIILKKNAKLGTHGNVRLHQGYDNTYEYGASGSISSYKNKLNWQLSSGYRQNGWREDLFLVRKVNNQTFDQESIAPYDPANFRVNGSLDYYINDKHSIGVSGRRVYTDSDRTALSITRIIDGSLTSALQAGNRFDRQQVVLNINPYYEYDDEKTKLNFDFNYVDYTNDNLNNIFQIGASTIDYNDQRYTQKGEYTILAYKFDYKRTVNDNFNWMAGSKYSLVDTKNDLTSFVQNQQQVFVLDNNQSNIFFIDESIFAAYTKLTATVDKWSFSGGVRWEQSRTTGTSTNPERTRERLISKLFPSASITRKLSENLGANISYSYRIQRPSYNSLNSFVYYFDPYTFDEGNPNLTPAFTNSFQFNLTYDDQPFFSVSYRDTKDALFELISQNNEASQISRSVINLSQSKNWSFRLFAPVNFLEGLDGFTGFIVNHNAFTSEDLNPDFNLSRWGFTWYTSIEYLLPWDINSEITSYYSSGGLEGQIEHEWIAGVGFALSKTLLNDKLKLNLGVGEILNRKFIGAIKSNGVDASVITDWSRWNVYFQATYNFGSKFNKNKNREQSSQEEQNRIGDNN